MRIVFIALTFAACVTAFSPSVRIQKKTASTTQLDLGRRELLTGLAGLLAAPSLANAAGSTFFFDDKIEEVIEPSQLATGGKLDINAAPVVSDGCRGFACKAIVFRAVFSSLDLSYCLR